MSDSVGDRAGFVAVDEHSLRALERVEGSVASARADLERATQDLLEIGEDMKLEAVRRLTERGASAAQVERYERAYRACAEAVRARTRALHEACGRMHDALSAVRA